MFQRMKLGGNSISMPNGCESSQLLIAQTCHAWVPILGLTVGHDTAIM
jgi:hypothetical protein